MRRCIVLFLCAVGLLLSAKSSLATTYAVGSCRPGLASYPTIGQAVSIAPSGSTVLVCPGTYPEQVTISTPLTLEGITVANSDRAIITVPAAGLAVNASSSALGMSISIAAQVLVTTGPVNIINITVDGTGNGVASPTLLAGIFYSDGASGTVNQVTTRHQANGGVVGTGIWAENDTASPASVTIENSSLFDSDDVAIVVVSTQNPPTLTATVKGNSVSNCLNGILSDGAAGSITGNMVTDILDTSSANGVGGIIDVSSGSVAASVSGNTVADLSNVGIVAFMDATGVVIKSNAVVNAAGGGIAFDHSGATIQSNKITTTPVGIDFECQTATVSGNTITNVSTGLNDVPLSVTPAANIFANVDALRSGGFCTAARTQASPKPQLPLVRRVRPN